MTYPTRFRIGGDVLTPRRPRKSKEIKQRTAGANCLFRNSLGQVSGRGSDVFRL